MNGEIMNGKYCSGTGDTEFLNLIEDSFEMMHPSGRLPNISMLYNQELDTFAEGFFWKGWWIQNSYGFAYSAVPFLAEPWIIILQNSLDLFWDRIGDGKRRGADNDENKNNKVLKLVAPDGCLGDCVGFGQGIFYKQGDGETDLHDWFYEATAAGIVMQAELLLRNHDITLTKKYLPLMERACNAVERIRDNRTNLFLAGPASNLLAPSYGGALGTNGSIEKGYPAGIAITYTAALQRMCELFIMVSDTAKESEYRQRTEITKAALPQLMTNEGYFVKSLDKDGTKHGVYGEKEYGYLEGVANADAMALDVVDRQCREIIYEKINSVKGIRPFDFLLTNYPELDDTYEIYLGKGHKGFFKFGVWVNGGCWGTVEGRAILGYFKLDKFEDAYKSAQRAMHWAQEYRMDAPFSQRGSNKNNPWSDRKDVSLVSVMVDNFAIPAATIRGLFEYNYSGNALTIIPHIPPSIKEYTQHEPVIFGGKRIFISIINGPAVKTATVNNKQVSVDCSSGLTLQYENLPQTAYIRIFPGEVASPKVTADDNRIPHFIHDDILIDDVPVELRFLYTRFLNIIHCFEESKIGCVQYCYAIEVLQAIKACVMRIKTPYEKKKYLRPMNKDKKAEIATQYIKTAESMAAGYLKKFT